MHPKFFRWLSLLGLLAFVAFDAAAQTPAPAAAAATPAGSSSMVAGEIKATRVVGNVTVEDKTTKATKALANGEVIYQGSIVHTAENSSVVLIFASGASINLAHTSDLDIETFMQDPFASNYEPAKATDEPSTSHTSIKLTRGELVGNVKKLKNAGQPGGSTFKVGTPVGAAGIRGTTFRIVYRPTGNGQAFNFVLTTVEGNVEVTLATSTVTAPVSVTQNTEVVLNNVNIDPATNTVTVTNAAGTQTVVVTQPPPTTTASTTNVQVTQAAAQQIIEQVATILFTPPPPPPPTTSTPTTGGGNTTGTTDQNANTQNQNTQNQQNTQSGQNQNTQGNQNQSGQNQNTQTQGSQTSTQKSTQNPTQGSQPPSNSTSPGTTTNPVRITF